MDLRAVLRLPGGDTVIRDLRDGLWAEPDGTADSVIGEGEWALPGLVDAHAHLARPTLDGLPGDLDQAGIRATRALEAGVGLILDKGWRDLTTVELIDSMPAELRPDVEAAGVIRAVEGGYWEGFAAIVPPGGIAPAVEEAAAEGRGWVKLVGDWPRKGVGPLPNFDEAELAEAVKVAAASGAKVAIHTMAREVPSMAVRAGVESIEHGLFLTADDLDTLGARGGTWVPTVMRVEATIEELGPESSGGRLLSEGLANIAANLAAAVEAGVHVLTGTDLLVGTDQVSLEAIRLWEMGLSPEAVVAACSSSGYLATGRPTGFEVGEAANAVFFPEDPLLDPKVLAHPSRIVRMGRVLG